MKLTNKYIQDQLKPYGGPRHNVEKLKKACQYTAKNTGHTPVELFRLLCFNQPLTGTHSYGFHTAYGRHLINTITNKYYLL